MKKIVIDARELRTTTGRYVERLLHYLQQVDHIHEYIVLLTPKDFDSWEPANRNFQKLKTPYKEFTFGEQLGFCKQLTDLHADLVFFPMVQQPVLYRGKVVTTMQDLTTIRFRNPTKNWLVFTVKREVYKWVNKYVARKSRALITPTQFVADDVANYTHVLPEKFTVTYESADYFAGNAEPITALKGKQFIMYLGRPLPHKNLWRLVEAYGVLKEKNPGLLLVLAGRKDVHYQDIEKRARNAGIEGVFFTGFISDQALKWLYQNCAAYVFPSLSEGFGLPALEAMLHGAPVVSSDATCLPEVYGDAAHYFDPLDIQDMATKINEVLHDKKLRAELVKKGRKQAGKYSWKRMAEQTLGVFKKALGETG
ncbi:MAG TPA: glycosyltransferase family 1 protein [Candidatus Saccharimonadales bacterium]|nr:glycosyltransferase family 1 protein [Candidatus Saccharimonadales bacterium]